MDRNRRHPRNREKILSGTRGAMHLSNQTSTPKSSTATKTHHFNSHCHTSNTMSKFHTFLFANQHSLHPELAPNVQKNDDANERERGDEDLGRSDLQTRAVVGVKLQDVLSATGPTAATGRCCASLCWSLLRPHDSRKQAYAIHSSSTEQMKPRPPIDRQSHCAHGIE